jgi:hypothetical protein
MRTEKTSEQVDTADKNTSLESRVEILELIAKAFIKTELYEGTFIKRNYFRELLNSLPKSDA